MERCSTLDAACSDPSDQMEGAWLGRKTYTFPWYREKLKARAFNAVLVSMGAAL